MKVVKFGGTSMANAECILRVKDIVLSDAERRYVVVSAPGKRESTDTKVTDLLYKCYDDVKSGTDVDSAFLPIEKRFDEILKVLLPDTDFTPEYNEIKAELKKGTTADYIASRGEYLSAKVTAKVLNFEFFDPKGYIVFSADGKYESGESNSRLKEYFKDHTNLVIPGFYGSMPDGSIKTFSRGGSDITGSIIARAAVADLYENFTDVDGFMKCDPRLTDSPQLMEMITYKELRELSYMGANVLHPESIFPVRKNDIPINIKNTFNPAAKGTMIVPTKKYFNGEFTREGSTVTGIAGKKDFVTIFIEKSMMNSELGFARKVLSVIENNNLSIEHMPTGVDTLSAVIDGVGATKEVLEKTVEEIKEAVKPDYIDIVRDLALIAIVGHGMSRKKGTAAKVFGALYNSDINIRMIDQGSSELNIIVGVENSDYEKAIACLYKALV